MVDKPIMPVCVKGLCIVYIFFMCFHDQFRLPKHKKTVIKKNSPSEKNPGTSAAII